MKMYFHNRIHKNLLKREPRSPSAGMNLRTINVIKYRSKVICGFTYFEE